MHRHRRVLRQRPLFAERDDDVAAAARQEDVRGPHGVGRPADRLAREGSRFALVRGDVVAVAVHVGRQLERGRGIEDGRHSGLVCEAESVLGHAERKLELGHEDRRFGDA